jgi:hypothetical protein
MIQSVKVDGTASTDADGDLLTYSWDFGNGQKASGPTASVSYGSLGEKTITLTVDDGHGGISNTSTKVTIISDVISSSSSSKSSVSSSSTSSSRSSIASGLQCNWYGTLTPLCVTTTSGWGWENNKSCVAASTCSAQPAPYGIVGGSSSSIKSSVSSTSSSVKTSSSSSSIFVSSSVPSSSTSSSKSSSSVSANKCQYIINDEWNTGFTGTIRITNSGTSAINGWSLQWNYTDGTTVTNSWNAIVTGGNPYSASNLDWNKTVQPGQFVEFGFQGTKSHNAPAQIPVVSGAVCQ